MLMVLFRINQSFTLFSLARQAQQCSVGFSHEYYFWHSDQPKLPSIQRLMQNLCWHYDSQQNLCWHYDSQQNLCWHYDSQQNLCWRYDSQVQAIFCCNNCQDYHKSHCCKSPVRELYPGWHATLHLYAWQYMQHCPCMPDSTGNIALVCMKVQVQVHLCAWQHMCRGTCLHDGTCASALVCMTVPVRVHLYAKQYMHDSTIASALVCMTIYAW